MVSERMDRRKPLQLLVYRIPMLSKSLLMLVTPIRSMYGIFTYIYHKKSTIHVGKIYNRPMDPMGLVVIQFQ